MANKNFIVGLFVVAGLVLFTVGLFLIGDRHEAFAKHMDFYAEFVNLGGLAKGAKVQVAGMDAGEVVEIGVPDSPSSRFRVKLRITENLHGLVRTDSVASIGTEGVVGDTFLAVRSGSPRALAAAPLSTLQSKEPLEISDLLETGQGVLNNVDGTVKDADGMLKTVGGKLNTALDGVTTTVSNVNDVVVGIKQGRGTAGMVLQDQALANQVRQTVANAQQATVDLSHASSQVNALTTDIQSRNLPQKVDDTLKSVQSAASNLDQSSQQIHQVISEVASPDEQGMSAGTNIRESLSNVNVATANMADETEALKHNFFFRGFFRHRGYYNLTNMPPDKYRHDKLFTSPANSRAWLSASDLFTRDANGVETLSSAGKQLLNTTLAQFGDSAVSNPIIIEGYWSGDSPADQLTYSRSRAILVREYLQNHFQIDPGNIGAVGLKNLPPDGLGHPTWDGVCIVVVKGH